MSASFNLARGLQFFTPIVIAILGKNYGLSTGIVLGSVFAAMAGLWIWKFPETRGRKLQEIDVDLDEKDIKNEEFKVKKNEHVEIDSE